MGPKYGVSMEEKRRRLLSIFKEGDENGRPTCYSLKELESIGSKRGVAGMQIKDIIQDLVSDKLIDCDKIGSGNFYWALPSKEGQRKRTRLASLTESVNKEQTKLALERQKNTTLKAERTEGKERDKNLAAVSKLKQEEATILQELQKYMDRDPVVLKALKETALRNFELTNRWGDNIYQTRQYAERNLNMEISNFDQEYEFTQDDIEAVGWTSFGVDL